jgi:hypothetical protein
MIDMKILIVKGEDYAATHFSNAHSGTDVINIINQPKDFLPKEGSDPYEQWELEVKEFEGNVNMELFNFARSFSDGTDDYKHQTYYHQSETVE